MPSDGYSLSITSLPYTVLWRPSAYGYNLRYGEGRMLHNELPPSLQMTKFLFKIMQSNDGM